MKIERINDNQIRCTLTSSDLSLRNINILELAYGTEKARKLFREMIQQASSEVGFEAEDIPLMIEAIPLSAESIMLVITKVEDPEELDTRFSKFSPFSEDGNSSLLEQLANDFLEGAPDSMACLEPANVTDAANQSQTADGENISGTSTPVSSSRIFRFDSLDRICEAAKIVDGIFDGPCTLYRKPDTRQYYLVLHRSGCTDVEFSRVCNILSEYAVKLSGDSASEAYFKEHYTVIIAEHALQALAQI